MTQILNLVNAIDSFITGCKSDGTWNSIKASCIMAGWSNLSGALTPLVGVAPIGFNFIEADYNPITGLQGDGSTKYISSSYAYPTSLQNNCHASVYMTVSGTSTSLGPSYTNASNNGTQLNQTGSRLYSVLFYSSTDSTSLGFRGVSRANSSTYIYRAGSNNETATAASVAVTHSGMFVFARNRGNTIDGYGDPRLAFYSIGESLDLALLDARVSGLMVAISGAIA